MGRRDRRALVALTAVVLMIGSGLGLVLSRTSQRRLGADGIWVQGDGTVPAGATACQGRETLPAGTEDLQIAAHATRPPLLTVRHGARVLARATATIGRRADLVEASIPRVARDVEGVDVCLSFPAAAVLFEGPTPPTAEGVRIGKGFNGASMAISYLEGGTRSWWAYAPTVLSRMGRRRWAGIGTGWLAAAFLLASLVLAGRLLLRTVVGGRPARRAAWTILAVAALNAAAWSFVTPPFQIPDEIAHVAYVQQIGETGAPSTAPRSILLSPEEMTAMADARYGSVAAPLFGAAVWSRAQERRLDADLRLPLPRRPATNVGEGEPEPPLYYALEAIPYRLAHGATLLDRIALMRLLSAVLGGVTALLCFLFVREALPAWPWAWPVGGLAVAFMPMLGFISGGVNPDALLLVLASALFLCVARAWRRGVTPRIALCLGGLIAAGMLAKVNFYGLVPGALLGLALAARRSDGSWSGRVARLLGVAAGLAAVGFALGTGFELLVWHRPFAVGRPAAPESHVGLLSHLSYIWQIFLPRLPFQAKALPGHLPYVQLFKTFVGTFGWLVVWLPRWAYRAAAIALALSGLLAARALAADRRELRWRRGELLGYGAMAAALALLVGLSADLRRNLIHIAQGRYLLPLLPLLGLLLALGARGAGERWGRAVGVGIVALTVAGTVFGQLATVAFFYT
jgi:hypothetical protein